ncbi:MAG: OmpA family protein [Prolixibacteraceae bacterium]|nr:OmpA family protein [Prolixibacteraceae bacterium]
MNQYESAIKYYENYISRNPEDNVAKYHYADLLFKTGNIIKARTNFLELKEKSPGNPEYERMIACCNFAISETEKPNKQQIKNQELINTEQSEFGLAFFKDKLIFASMRLTDDYSSIHGRTNQGFSDFFSAGFDTVFNMFNNTERLSGNINSPFNEGTFTYNEGLNTAFFTQCKKNPDLCKILKAKYEKNKWDDIKEVLLGQPDYNFAHPSLSSDGATLYFASDLPGGLGGKDLWKAPVFPDGGVGDPVHLGNSVNTPNDDMFPLIIGDSILFFASDGHIGMGGLDIYYSKIENGLYDRPKNVGAPINSTGDDFSILINPDFVGGYFCSNRNNTEKSDDVFAFFHNIILDDITGKVIDSLTLQPISDVKITYSTEGVPKIIVYSDSLGVFYIPGSSHTNCDKKHSLAFEKEGYLLKNVIVPCNVKEEMLVFLDDGSGIFHSLLGNILNKNTGLPVEGAMVTIKSLKGLNDTIFTDANGVFSVNKIPRNDYIILRASKENYLKDSRALGTPDEGKSVTMSKKTGFDTDFDLIPIEFEVEFEIENIYYEFDKARLLPKSKTSLDKLVNLLNENPRVKIQLNSHTDERGGNAYNLNLSHRRSASVVTYLVGAGINKTRLISRGFGETQPEIKNAKTEEEHQKNRRSAFEIVGEIIMAKTGTGYSLDIPETRSSRDDKILENLREADNQNNDFSNVEVLDLKIKAALDNKVDKTVDIESGELLKINRGEITKTTPVVPVSKKEDIKEEEPTSLTPARPATMANVYRIQLLATSRLIDIDKQFLEINDLVEKHGIFNDKENNLNKYRLGNFNTKDQASEIKELLKQRGFKDCFVVEVKK